MKTKVLRALKQSEGYLSGQELCEQCGVSRTAIWKVVNQLKESGYIIDSVPNKGYRIVSYPDILSKTEIESVLEQDSIVTDVYYFDETDSTNNFAKRLGEEGAKEGTFVVADCQTSGKGRRGRTFQSPKGQSIYMTILLRPQIAPYKASMITILSAMAIRKGLQEVCGIESNIKWPNDIVTDGKKICGILTEMSAETEWVNYVVVGIGINVNNDEMPEELKDVAISARMITGREEKRSLIIASSMKWFGEYYRQFLKTQDLSAVRDEYNSYLIHYGKEIEVIKDTGKFRAKSLGIADDGELLIDNNGNIERLMSGEVSVRGVYGYV